MAITKLYLEKFKGINNPIEINFKPINIFIGPNSSGKSTFLHSLALLKQTLANPTGKKALLLDYEKALVHLGRYEDVVFNHDYNNKIGIGIDFSRNHLKAVPSLKWKFRGTKRTQEIFVHSLEMQIGKKIYNIKQKTKEKYIGTVSTAPGYVNCLPQQNFIFNVMWRRANYKVYQEWFSFQRVMQVLTEEINNIYYLGPFRQPPQRRYDTRGVTPTEVGVSGELTVPLIVNEIIRKRKRPHIERVLEWLQLLDLSKELKLNREGTSDIFKIELKTHDKAPVTTPVDVGYGVSQVLPVLVQCSFLEDNSTLLLEQPELHLHPNIQSKLADILIQTAYGKKSTLLIETHSERLVNGMFEAIRSKKLKHTDINLINVNHKDDSIKIEIHEPNIHGEVDGFNWHKNFCSDY